MRIEYGRLPLDHVAVPGSLSEVALGNGSGKHFGTRRRDSYPPAPLHPLTPGKFRDTVYRMDLSEHAFSGFQVSELTGVGQDALRQWRKRGFLEDFGIEQANGRWMYSGIEILIIAMARVWGSSAPSVPNALWMASNAVSSVLYKIKPDADLKSSACDYVVFWMPNVGRPSIRTADIELKFLPTNDLRDIVKAKSPSVFVVHAEQMAGMLPAKLLEALRHGFSKSKG